jgi:hypothetical protein
MTNSQKVSDSAATTTADGRICARQHCTRRSNR